MPITEFPILPSDYPLFDWADWPKSYAALVPGGPTKAFEKACWNAIVDHMVEALEAAGLSWRDGIQDPEVLKMYEEGNVRLKAGHMNNFRRGIDNVVELPWRWEYDESFRGYIGEPFFNQFVGEKKQVVYPEYLKELVRHVNMAIEIMRGTAQTEMQSAELLVRSLQKVSAERRNAATLMIPRRSSRTTFTSGAELVTLGNLLDFPKQNSTTNVAGPEWLWARIIEKYILIKTTISPSGTILKSGSLSAGLRMNSSSTAELDFMRMVQEMAASLPMHSLHQVSMDQSDTLEMNAVEETRSKISAEATRSTSLSAIVSQLHIQSLLSRPVMDLTMKRQVASAKTLSKSSIIAETVRNRPSPLFVSAVSGSLSTVGAETSSYLRTDAQSLSNSGTDAEMLLGTVKAIRENHFSKSKTSAPVLLYRTAPVFTEKKSAVAVNCTVEILGWEYPEWINGGLLIRQAYSAIQTETGELEVR